MSAIPKLQYAEKKIRQLTKHITISRAKRPTAVYAHVVRNDFVMKTNGVDKLTNNVYLSVITDYR
jgi:hypothetical protein